MKKWLWEMIYCFWMKSCLMPTQRQEILQHFTTHFKGFQRLNQRDDSKCIRYSNTHHLDTGNVFQEKSHEKSQIPLLKQSVMDVSSIFLRWNNVKNCKNKLKFKVCGDSYLTSLHNYEVKVSQAKRIVVHM